MSFSKITHYTRKEGMEWIKIMNPNSILIATNVYIDSGAWNSIEQTLGSRVHAIRIEDGREADVINGWRDAKKESEKIEAKQIFKTKEAINRTRTLPELVELMSQGRPGQVFPVSFEELAMLTKGSTATLRGGFKKEDVTIAIGENFSGLPSKNAIAKEEASVMEAILSERGSRYGSFVGHAAITQLLKSDMKNTPKWDNELSDSQREALEMIAHKIGRILNGDPNYADSWVDICGYSQLIVDELASKIR
jgi:hypothetical protein